jgi:hypothetical protein
MERNQEAISEDIQISDMPSPALYFARVLEKIRIVLCLATAIQNKRIMSGFNKTWKKTE